MIGGTLAWMAQAQASVEPAVERRPYGVLLARLGQEAIARFRRSLRPLQLSAQEFIVLRQLSAMGPTSQTALAEALAVDNSNLGGVTAQLLSRDAIERPRDRSDRRRYLVDLTPSGRRLLSDADAAIRADEDDMLSALDETELAQLWDLLRRVADSIALCPDGEAQSCAQAEAAEGC
jgi:DNA-binding MarR family transcriptional regulator